MRLRSKRPATDDRMTTRARTFMGVVVLRHGVLGLFCLLDSNGFSETTYVGMAGAMPVLGDEAAFITWGVLLLLSAALAMVSVITASPDHAKTGLLFSVGITSSWFFGLLATALQPGGSGAGWAFLVALLGLVLKDLTMIREPMRNPFEEVIKVIASSESRIKRKKVSLADIDAEIAATKRDIKERAA